MLQYQSLTVNRYFEKVEANGMVTYKHYIYAGGKVVAIHDRKSDFNHVTHYLHRDHLGSVDTITDETGEVLTRTSFDAFGQRRLAENWNDGFPTSTELDVIRNITTRGYTGHQMVDAINLIHMGGRIYDPELGRFLSPDPDIPSPYNTQAYNRYSYVYNNPLSYSDPSGFVPDREDPEYIDKDERGHWRIGVRHSEVSRAVDGGGVGAASGKSISDEGMELLKNVEGFRPKPYDDDTGEELDEWVEGATIGYGHLIGEKEWARYAKGITKAQAHQLLAADLAVAENAVRTNITATVSQNQYDAMVILAFNIGENAFASSSVARMVNNPGARTPYPTLRDAWSAWKYQNCPNCSISRGLINRRQAEWNVYSRGVYEW